MFNVHTIYKSNILLLSFCSVHTLSFCVQRSLLRVHLLFNFYYFSVLYIALILFFLSSARYTKAPRLSFISSAIGRYWNTATINGRGSPTITFYDRLFDNCVLESMVKADRLTVYHPSTRVRYLIYRIY